MKMDLFLDTNIVVDIVKYREPYVYDALPIFQGGRQEFIICSFRI